MSGPVNFRFFLSGPDSASEGAGEDKGRPSTKAIRFSGACSEVSFRYFIHIA